MLIVHVHIKVKTEYLQAFQQASIENARHSIQEPGISRFELIQAQDDPSSFLLLEAYAGIEAQAKHKETAHFKKWVETVGIMMAEPRYAVKYSNVYP
ncbi:MAG: putative quinol monooxygenase [Spirochaetota bacterium]